MKDLILLKGGEPSNLSIVNEVMYGPLEQAQPDDSSDEEHARCLDTRVDKEVIPTERASAFALERKSPWSG